METRRQRAARAEAARVAEGASPSLAEQPTDVLALVGAELSDALTPGHLTALASTCGALQLALRAALVELKETRRAVSALLRKCSNPRKTEYTLEQAASGDVDVIFGGSKGLDDADARLMARCLFGNACFSVNNLWAYDNPRLGDAGVAALARAFQRRPQQTLKCLSLTETSMGDAGVCALAATMAAGALPRLTHLYLNQNGIGDEGLKAFCAAIVKGALPKLEVLDLQENGKITDAQALVSALAGGALPSLAVLRFVGTAHLKAACEARAIILNCKLMTTLNAS